MWTTVLWVGILMLGLAALIGWFRSGAKARNKQRNQSGPGQGGFPVAGSGLPERALHAERGEAAAAADASGERPSASAGTAGEPRSANADDGEADTALPVPVTGMEATVTDPIPGRGYGEIRVALGGVDYYFMAACLGEDWIPADERVTVAEVRDGIVYVFWNPAPRAEDEVDNR